MSWDVICRPKENGGLDVKNVESFHLSLLGKSKWRLLNNSEDLVVRILFLKLLKDMIYILVMILLNYLFTLKFV